MTHVIRPLEPEEIANASCSFCGKPHDQVVQLTFGPGDACICNKCVDYSRQLIEEKKPMTLSAMKIHFFRPCTACGASCRRTDHYCSQCGQKLDQVDTEPEGK